VENVSEYASEESTYLLSANYHAANCRPSPRPFDEANSAIPMHHLFALFRNLLKERDNKVPSCVPERERSRRGIDIKT